ncbi:drug resistance transporter, EmrB/QacA subfamily [Jatrophihabitans endophyticus]|uniref:Drug resistance transporter, EmrB/QacA subfamily n=1 Tax=Jatrophihabitans endophyticus TaxID=1206085 RepID=A0A1M5RNW8_9ACTN|nr:DHA2 family efflux MFS transporter permease subunit [Jatrophihabitans endophyticus]SHH27994.1 drug resistance transporter, EmrB/QacA subfamily [Jatrophihabitans endophyticus]
MRTSSRWVALVVLCVAELLVSIDNTIVNVALPSLARQLSASTSGLQWIVDAYTLVFTGLLLVGGHLGDRLGRRRALLVGLVGFGAVSVGAATTDSLAGLVSARAVMGAFAALIFPATLAIVTNIFTETRERVAAVGIWSAVAGVAVAVGPVSGGWLLEHFSWHSVFWVNVPLAAVAVLATVRWVPESRAPHAGGFDLGGVVLSVAGLTTLVWTVIEGPHHGWTSGASLAGFTAAAALLALFMVHERRVVAPVLDVTLFANRRFSAAAGAISVAFFGLFGFIFLVTQYFQAVKGYGTLAAGVRTLPFAIVIGALSPVALQVAQRIGTTVVVTGGLVLMSGGFALASTAQADSPFFGRIIASMVLMAAGLALVSGPATEAIMGALPLHQAGAGSAVNDTTRELGGTLGVAVLGSVLASLYASRVSDTAAALPSGVRDTVRSSVVGGLDAAAARRDAGLADAVRQAFLAGMHDASLVAAGATLVGAAIVAVALPARARPAQDAPPVPLAV